MKNRRRLASCVTAAVCLVPLSAAAQAPSGPEVKPKFAYNFGSEKEDALASFALDKDGNFWVAGMNKGLVDGFTYDWFVAKLSSDAKPQWMRVYGSANEDSTMRHIDMAGEGLPRMLALVPDGSGAIVVGRSGTDHNSAKAPDAAVIWKVKPDGSLAWSKAFRPGWENKMIQGAGATSVTVVGKRAYVVGVTAAESMGWVSVFDTDSGELKSSNGYDFGPTYNDRLFSIVADEKNKALYAGGWSGQGNKGVIAKLSLEDSPKLQWAKRIPNGWGSTIPDLDLDQDGNVYLASEVHGAKTWVEAWKLTPDGKVVWRIKYDTNTNGPTNNTHALRLINDKVVILGRIGYGNTQTHSDQKFGDSLLLVLDKDGNKVRDLFHFTGTAGGWWAMERSRGVAVKGDVVYVAGNTWSEGANYAGQWRKPDDYKLPGVVTKDAGGPLEDITVKVEDQTKAGTKDATWLKWTDTSAQLTVGAPEEMSRKVQRSTQGYIYGFEKLF